MIKSYFLIIREGRGQVLVTKVLFKEKALLLFLSKSVRIQNMIKSYFLIIRERRASSSQKSFEGKGFASIPAKIWKDSKYICLKIIFIINWAW